MIAPIDSARNAEQPIVLVAEDEVLIRMVVADSLRDAGFTVIEASNATEALSAVRAGLQPHALVTDIKMPGELDGLALAALLLQEIPALRVFVTSAHIDGAHPSLAAEYVAKPYDPHVVVQSVRRALSD